MSVLKISLICYSFYLYKRSCSKHLYKMQFRTKKFRKYRTRVMDFIDIYLLSYVNLQYTKNTTKFLSIFRTYFK